MHYTAASCVQMGIHPTGMLSFWESKVNRKIGSGIEYSVRVLYSASIN